MRRNRSTANTRRGSSLRSSLPRRNSGAAAGPLSCCAPVTNAPQRRHRQAVPPSAHRSAALPGPGVPAPTDPWAPAVIPLLGLERRGAKLYRPGVGSSLGARGAEAAELEARLGAEPIKVEDARLARFLEEQGRLVRVGDGYAISTAAYEQGRAVLVRELEEVPRITLARFRDLLQTSRKTAQLLLERFDADGITRRVGDERVLRRAGARR